ncbi:hypothetical protein ACSLVN_27695, partial [Klebsiella pneumoniae]|uniref:hypothetical protein n=1 Tax=Klebsiella pneumoniae TaxID=573 RepID=UPI003EDEE30F
RSALANLRGGKPAQVADALWRMRDEAPADASSAQRRARRRDLSFLAAVSWLRSLEGGARDGSLHVDKVVEALEESLDADAAFAPAA